jgi:nucleotidyltransferase/DNA polymerase involved in DNA repair
MDCFFVACSLRSRPELKGQPVAIAWGGKGSDSNGEISSCSYEARALGVTSGMWLKQAREKCPHIVVVPYEFEQYQRVSEQVYRLLFTITNNVEISSCDEAYLDISNVVQERENGGGGGGGGGGSSSSQQRQQRQQGVVTLSSRTQQYIEHIFSSCDQNKDQVLTQNDFTQ